MLNAYISSSENLEGDGGDFCERLKQTKIFGDELLPNLVESASSGFSKESERSDPKYYDHVDNVFQHSDSHPCLNHRKYFHGFAYTASICSHLLPKDDNIVLAVVLSKWDDIMGPQTLHIWLQEDSEQIYNSAHLKQEFPPNNHFRESVSESSRNENSHSKSPVSLCELSEDSSLLSAVKYVTNHTVNCLTVSGNFGSSNSWVEKGTSFFAVPDINIVFLSLLFQVREQKTSVPYSIALIVNYEHYDYFRRLRVLCLQWLRRIALRFHISLSKISTAPEFCIWKNLDDWILQFCSLLVQLKQCGLQAAPYQVPFDVIETKILRRALTSHLQTFGSSVVIGKNSSEVNTVIAFLAMFLEENERYSTSLVDPSRKCSFNMGLKLQGLVLDEFGGRDLASVELIANPIPVTIIDLTVGDIPSAVKQSSHFHFHSLTQQEIYKQEYRFLNKDNGCSEDHESVMHSVRENGKLVEDIIMELKVLPLQHWEKYISMFLARLNHLALTLLNLVSWVKKTGGGVMKLPGEGKTVSLMKYLKRTLKVKEPDFLIILSKAEELRPGTYAFVMGVDHS
ncbi:hypothetical protein J437_LFUL015651 [Ladona fulva]|uniref:Uncharacterized protein n=1 Tax=Ladona fulva TaxID=123851 RepID=A0A8K0KET6_LADFU|nr:hypothetical protein J437_LFUL015651 [Ladona fulva]